MTNMHQSPCGTDIARRIVTLILIYIAHSPLSICQDRTLHDNVLAVDAYFQKLEAYGLSGSLLIGTKDEILLKKNYGINSSAKDEDIVYLVGSITKQFTATAILLLEQKGHINTSEMITSYLSNIPPDKAGITIHQLLTHTAGLNDDYWDQHSELSEDEYIEMMLRKDLISQPGERFGYCNFGYHLLAKIIEEVSNKNYESFLAQDLFRPAGISNTGFSLVNWKKNQIAHYNDWTTAGNEHIIKDPLDRPIFLQPDGSGGILSTSTDMYKWYQAVFHTNKLLSAKSREKLLTTEKANYAYGWEVYSTSRGTKLIEHGAYDDWVGVVSGLYYFADEDLVVIFLGNTHMSEFLRKDYLMNNIESIIFGGQVHMPPLTNHHPDKDEITANTGIYKNGDNTISISKGKIENQLLLRTSDRETIQQLLFPSLKDQERSDAQVALIFENLQSKNYEILRDHFIQEIPFEYLQQRYSATWNQLTSAMGAFKGFKVIQTIPSSYEGKFELQILLELQFEHGKFYLIAFRNHHGRIQLQPLEVPEKLELFFSPANKNEFKTWNIKTNITSTIRIEENNLIINGMNNLTYQKI